MLSRGRKVHEKTWYEIREHVPVFNGDWSPPGQELARTTFDKTNSVINEGFKTFQLMWVSHLMNKFDYT